MKGQDMDFSKKQPKVNMTVRVDPDIVQKAKKKNLNISEIVRVALDKAVNGEFVPEDNKRRRGA